MQQVIEKIHHALFVAAAASNTPKATQAAIRCAKQPEFNVDSGREYLYDAVYMQSTELLKVLIDRKPNQQTLLYCRPYYCAKDRNRTDMLPIFELYAKQTGFKL